MARLRAGNREWGLPPDARTTGLCAAFEVAGRTARASSEAGVACERPGAAALPARTCSRSTSPLTGVGGWSRAQAPFAVASTQAFYKRCSRSNRSTPRTSARERGPENEPDADTWHEVQARIKRHVGQRASRTPTPGARCGHEDLRKVHGSITPALARWYVPQSNLPLKTQPSTGAPALKTQPP